MGVFGRIGDIIKANINDLLDRAEDPQKMIKQLINELQQDVSEATSALAKAKTSSRIAKRQLEQAQQESKDWESKAEYALKQGDEDLAKEALSKKVEADSKVSQYQKMYDEISAQTEKIDGQVKALREKLEEARGKEAMLLARAQMADTRKSLAKASGGIDTTSTADKFDRLEQKIIEKEAEADAYEEIQDDADGLDDDTAKKFKTMESKSKVDDELLKLKEKLGLDK